MFQTRHRHRQGVIVDKGCWQAGTNFQRPHGRKRSETWSLQGGAAVVRFYSQRCGTGLLVHKRGRAMPRGLNRHLHLYRQQPTNIQSLQ
jgi:hypothetical protein